MRQCVFIKKLQVYLVTPLHPHKTYGYLYQFIYFACVVCQPTGFCRAIGFQVELGIVGWTSNRLMMIYLVWN